MVYRVGSPFAFNPPRPGTGMNPEESLDAFEIGAQCKPPSPYYKVQGKTWGWRSPTSGLIPTPFFPGSSPTGAVGFPGSTPRDHQGNG
ncbi:hypothetical protein [Oscillatoria acuminata]|uniref:Uncharacterized protein n=1 Tax=Oscillatoria acuminata PCC 6304 TaxID=56110 RepID=K9TLN0_9CYAN|nr:hypothetical protein [Oscillatoria acuminata]AFY83308.1 hypothetical protein Oscil6304_3749 [Oscillatoria acuminata PCC 6304]